MCAKKNISGPWDFRLIQTRPLFHYTRRNAGSEIVMEDKLMNKVLFALLLGLSGSAYAGDLWNGGPLPKPEVIPPAVSKTIAPPLVVFKIKANDAITAIQKGDLGALAWMVDGKMGLKFSPSAYIEADSVVIPKGKLGGLMKETVKHTWASDRGDGEPLALTATEYYTQYVYDADYASYTPVYNQRVLVNNTIDNIRELYPNAMVAEFHNPGTAAMADLDKSSLRLVFVERDYDMYLAAIVHDK